MNKTDFQKILFQNALTEILREIQKCPDDSIQDIANEILEGWHCGFQIDHNFNPIEY